MVAINPCNSHQHKGQGKLLNCYSALAKFCQGKKKLFFLKKLVIFHVFTTFKITKSAAINSVLCAIKTYVENLCTDLYFFGSLCLKNVFSKHAESWNNNIWASFCCTNSETLIALQTTPWNKINKLQCVHFYFLYPCNRYKLLDCAQFRVFCCF